MTCRGGPTTIAPIMEDMKVGWRPLAVASIVVALVLPMLGGLAGCAKPPAEPPPQAPPLDYSRQLPPGRAALRKLSPGEYPEFGPALWGASDFPALRAAIANSLAYLERPGSRAGIPTSTSPTTAPSRLSWRCADLLNDATLVTDAKRFDTRRSPSDLDVYKSIGA